MMFESIYFYEKKPFSSFAIALLEFDAETKSTGVSMGNGTPCTCQ